MDNDIFERVINIRERNGESFDNKPRYLNDSEKEEFIVSLKSLYNDFSLACHENDMNNAINSLNEIIYLCLDYMAKIGVYPCGVIQSIVNAQLYRVIDDKLHCDYDGMICPPLTNTYYSRLDGKIHFDKNRENNPPEFKTFPGVAHYSMVSPLSIIEAKNDLENCITEMELGIYKKVEKNDHYVGDLGNLYQRIREVNNKFNFPCGKEESILKNDRVSSYLNKLDNMIRDFNDYQYYPGHSAFYLGDVICMMVNIFVEMGINPKEYFNEYLNEKEEQKRK